MYICADCGRLFDEPSRYPEPRPVDPYEEYTGCPTCGSGFYDDAEKCQWCNEYRLKEQLYAGTLCGNCVNWIRRTRPTLVTEYIDEDRQAFAEFLIEKLLKK